MQKKTKIEYFPIILIGLFVFGIITVSLTGGVMASTEWFLCGDGMCDNDPDYNESNAMTIYYCPQDCGILTSSTWCESTYALIAERDCPTTTCPTTCGGSSCDISRISDTNLNNWCISNYHPANTTMPTTTEENKYIWIIVIAVILYLIFKGRKKR